jgi:hypothetical protein
MKQVPIPGKDKDRAWQSIWQSEFGKIRVTQSVEIIIGEQTRLYDTALIRYQIWNRDKEPHIVGLRFMLDPQVGSSKGLPYYVPPLVQNGHEIKPAHFLDDLEVFKQSEIPDFIQAAQSKQLDDPNLAVALLRLKIKGAEPLEKMVICRWPPNSEARWGGTGTPGDWAYEPMKKDPDLKDPCIALYWAKCQMKPDEHRQMAFTYGLGHVWEPPDTRGPPPFRKEMRLFVGPNASFTRPFTVFAYLRDVEPGQTVELALPKGLEFEPGWKAVQNVPAPGPYGLSLVTWQLRAIETGAFIIEATAPGIGFAAEKVLVNQTGIGFDG